MAAITMSERFFVERSLNGDQATLVDTEAHHLIHVMRGRPGDRVTLFDGTGMEYTAEVTKVGRGEVALTIVDQKIVDRELPIHLTLAVAMPKGDRQRWLVEKAVELGVSRLVPLRTARSVAQPESGAICRMVRWVIGASKQCGRNRLMEIADPVDWAQLLDDRSGGLVRLFAHPGGQNLTPGGYADSDSKTVIAAVGSEGGFADDEVAAANDAGWQAVGLGRRILRVETAAMVMATILAVQHEGSTD